MAANHMYKIPISGGPHAGKTTLIKELEREFPEAYFVPEPATKVIEHELELAKQNPGYEAIVPWKDYSKFEPLVVAKSLELERAIPEDTRLVFQDRSLIDTVGYCSLNGFESFIPEIQRKIKAARYAFAFFCEPVGIYAATNIRRETAEEAQITRDYLWQAYEESGIEVIHLPDVAVEARVTTVKKVIAKKAIYQ